MSKQPSSLKIQDPDEALVRAINDGGTEHFAVLVGRYEQRLYNFALKMCRDVRDAEDLVQETFLSVFRYLSGFRFEAKFLRALALNPQSFHLRYGRTHFLGCQSDSLWITTGCSGDLIFGKSR